MKFLSSTAVALTALLSSCGSMAGNEFPVLESPYLGQKPPGLTPARFAPGLVSTEHWEYGGTFTPDMHEYYFINEDVEAKKMNFVLYKYEKWRMAKVNYIAPGWSAFHIARR